MDAVERIHQRSETVRMDRARLRQAEEALRLALVDGFREGLTGHVLAKASGLPLAMVVVIPDPRYARIAGGPARS